MPVSQPIKQLFLSSWKPHASIPSISVRKTSSEDLMRRWSRVPLMGVGLCSTTGWRVQKHARVAGGPAGPWSERDRAN